MLLDPRIIQKLIKNVDPEMIKKLDDMFKNLDTDSKTKDIFDDLLNKTKKSESEPKSPIKNSAVVHIIGTEEGVEYYIPAAGFVKSDIDIIKSGRTINIHAKTERYGKLTLDYQFDLNINQTFSKATLNDHNMLVVVVKNSTAEKIEVQ